ncbi:MAG: dephospho-CoA kinase [Verrucomicrobiota bacterium]
MEAGDANLLPSFFLDMISWIITGGVGCGKSSLTEKLCALIPGTRRFSADESVGRILQLPAVHTALIKAFGPKVVVSREGVQEVDRAVLREIVFQDEKARLTLEAITHPAVLADLEAERKASQDAGAELFLAEVPLYYEIGATVEADLIIVVAVRRTMQAMRLMERRGLDEAMIERILRSQWPIEAKVEGADTVIWNEGDLTALEAQALTLARQLRQA